MSFLSEVVNEATKIEYKEVIEKLSELQIEIDNLKQEIFTYLKETYIYHVASPKTRDDFDSKILNYHKEIEILMKKLKNAKKKNKNASKRLSHLRHCHKCIVSLTHLCQIHNQFVVFQRAIKDKKYDEAVEILTSLELNITNTFDEEFSSVIEEFKLCIASKKTDLLIQSCDMFFENIFLTYDKTVILKIDKHTDDEEEILAKLIPYFIDHNVFYNLANIIIKKIFETLTKSACHIEIMEDEKCKLLKMVELEKPVVYTQFYSTVVTVFQFIEEIFGIPKNSDLTIYKHFSGYIGQKVWTLINKYLREHIIPSLSNGVLETDKVIKETEDFDNNIAPFKVLPDENCSFVNYLKNSMSHYIQDETYLKTAEEIMKSNLNITETVNITFENEKHHCKVSQSVPKLIAVIEKICANLRKEKTIAQIIKIVKNFVSSYGVFVKEYHKTSLNECPKAAAIFHNNCFCMSENIARILERDFNSRDVSCFEDIHQLKLQAVDYFSKIVDEQMSKIAVKLSSKTGIKGTETLANTIEKKTHVESCFKQIKDLKKSWDDILPQCLSSKAIGQIVNSLCDHFIKSSLDFGDVFEDKNEHLSELLNIMLKFVNNLFKGTDINKLVPNWKKIELMLVGTENENVNHNCFLNKH